MNIVPWIIILVSLAWVAGWASGYATLRDKIKKGQVIEINGKPYASREQVTMDAPKLGEFVMRERPQMPVAPQVKENQG